MSRSNHNYDNLCYWLTTYGVCDCTDKPWRSHKKCYGERSFQGRRGTAKRRSRYPEWSAKRSHGGGPPTSIKKIWIGEARAKQNAEQRLNADDPIITPMKRLINLWDWY